MCTSSRVAACASAGVRLRTRIGALGRS